jgi:hypothetical protein
MEPWLKFLIIQSIRLIPSAIGSAKFSAINRGLAMVFNALDAEAVGQYTVDIATAEYQRRQAELQHAISAHNLVAEKRIRNELAQQYSRFNASQQRRFDAVDLAPPPRIADRGIALPNPRSAFEGATAPISDRPMVGGSQAPVAQPLPVRQTIHQRVSAPGSNPVSSRSGLLVSAERAASNQSLRHQSSQQPLPAAPVAISRQIGTVGAIAARALDRAASTPFVSLYLVDPTPLSQAEIDRNKQRSQGKNTLEAILLMLAGGMLIAPVAATTSAATAVSSAAQSATGWIGSRLAAKQIAGAATAATAASTATAAATWVDRIADKAISLSNLVTGIHNAFFLSSSVVTSLDIIVFSVLKLGGKKEPRNNMVSKFLDDSVAKAVGAQNWKFIKVLLQKLNIIYSSGISVIATARRMVTRQNAFMAGGRNEQAELMNALKDSGLVAEDAYGYKSTEHVLPAQPTAGQRVQNVADTIADLAEITSQLASLKDTLKQIDEDYQRVYKEIAEKERKLAAAANKIKADANVNPDKL